MTDFQSGSVAAASVLADILNENLQSRLDDVDWEHGLTLEANGSTLVFEYEEETEDSLFDSEFGTEYKPRQSVIRPFLKDAEVVINNYTQQAALDFLFDGGLV